MPAGGGLDIGRLDAQREHRADHGRRLVREIEVAPGNTSMSKRARVTERPFLRLVG